jgi:hypothetical protein
MISAPYLTKEESGKIAVAGPMMNVALAFALKERLPFHPD